MTGGLSDRPRVLLTWLFAALAVVLGAGLFTAAALTPAPPAVLPLVVLVCIGGPMVGAWELRAVVARGRRPRTLLETPPLDSGALAALRARLDQLPEIDHPLGL